MKSYFFRKNFIRFLIPVLIPVLVFSVFVTIVTQYYITAQVNKSERNLLVQMRAGIENIISDADAFNLNFSYNTQQINALLPALNGETLTYAQLEAIEDAKGPLDVAVSTRPYLSSIYVYLENQHGRFLTTQSMLADLEHYGDMTWYTSYLRNAKEHDLWLERRNGTADVLSVYRTIYFMGVKKVGVIVYNINADYLEESLRELELSPQQRLYVLGGDGSFVCGFPEDTPPGPEFRLRAPDRSLHVSSLGSDSYGLSYYSAIPQKILYEVPYRVMGLAFTLVMLSVLLAGGLTYHFNKKNHTLFLQILSVLDAAEKGEELPQLERQNVDEYDYIVQNLLRTFLNNSYLQMQLSEKKHRVTLLELQELHAQLNPHFLMNTLDTIYWKVIALSNGPNEVCGMIEDLSDILKYSLSNPSGVVPLRKEIDYSRAYLKIQRVRYSDRFDVFWDYDERYEECSVPKLILQPLLENAIYHGVKEVERHCTIKIRITQTEHSLILAVLDTGKGLTPEQLVRVRHGLDGAQEEDGSDRIHIGLANTQRRLRLLFGEHAALTIRSRENLLTSVRIRIPTK